MANLSIDGSDSRSDASSPGDSMEGSQCVEEQDYSFRTNTEEQNSPNELNYKIAEVTLNDTLEGFFVSENVTNLSNLKPIKAEFSLLSKGLKFYHAPNKKRF